MFSGCWCGFSAVFVHTAHSSDTLCATPAALQSVAWNSGGLDTYLTEAGQLVRELDGLLSCIKGTVAQAQGILQQWQRDVMFERKEGRVARYEELSSTMRDLIASRHAAVTGALGSKGHHCSAAERHSLPMVQGMPATFPGATTDQPTVAFLADGGKEIAKHVAALARTLKVNKGAAAWRR